MSMVESLSPDTPTIGVLGRPWRASVSPWGAVVQWDGLGTLDWFVAADDRWHVPSAEPTVRQRLIDGTPVIETRVRVPQGDAVQRVYAVADHGGLTIVEVENDSALPIAVAFSGVPVLSARPAAQQPPQGIDLPPGAVVFPVGHHATVTVAICHDGARPGPLPTGLPSAMHVVRGWTTICDRASRLLVPEPALTEAVVRVRCQLMLDGPVAASDDPVGFLLGASELVRMGSVADEWMPEVAEAVAGLVRRRSDPRLGAALDAADRICVAASDTRAQGDLRKVRARLAPADAPADAPFESGTSQGVRSVSDLERTIARGGDLFPGGLPVAWLGSNFEVYGVPTGAGSAVSLAVRWHGERPAVLWECTGDAPTLTASVLAPGWSSADPSGEALWAPVLGPDSTLASSGSGADGESHAGAPSGDPDGNISFG